MIRYQRYRYTALYRHTVIFIGHLVCRIFQKLHITIKYDASKYKYQNKLSHFTRHLIISALHPFKQYCKNQVFLITEQNCIPKFGSIETMNDGIPGNSPCIEYKVEPPDNFNQFEADQ